MISFVSESISSEKETERYINETYLSFIQTDIARMGQKTFQAKAWNISVVTALLIFSLSTVEIQLKQYAIIAAGVVSILFCILDAYYLYLERGYRYLYKLAAHLNNTEALAKDFDMEIPEGMRGFFRYLESIASITTGLFYGGIIVLLIILGNIII